MKSLAKLYANVNNGLLRFGGTYCLRRLVHDTSATLATINKRGSYLHMTDSRPLIGATFGQIIDAAPERFGDQLALIDCAQGIRKTHVELKEDIDKLATGLLSLNLQRGDRIAIWCPNKYEWVLTHLAVSKAGLILLTINPAFQPNELAYCLAKVGVRALVFSESFKTQNYYQMIQKVVPEVTDSKPGQIKSKTYPNFDTLIALSNKDFPGSFKLNDVINAGGIREKERLEKIQNEIQFDDIVNIQFTSGTTGSPKAATLTHLAMINNCVIVDRRSRNADENVRICCNVPLFHTYGTVAVSTSIVTNGICAVFPAPGYSMEDSLKAIEKEKCTSFLGTPTMLLDMINHPNFSKTDISSLKRVSVGGAPLAPELMKEALEKLNYPRVGDGYGSTETSMAVSCHDFRDEQHTKFGNVGRPIPHIEVKIVDVNDKIVPLGTEGEICIRGYNIMKGYWDEEEKTKEVIKDGWYHSGDLGSLSENGNLMITGRLKDMIIRGGENIFPKEIEDYLITHPKIIDVYVIGIPDRRMGEELCACIKLKTKETITENEVKDFCKEKISHFKIPRYIRVVDSFPLTAIGKVKKYVLQEEMIKILELENVK